jgi:hypothetical protein
MGSSATYGHSLNPSRSASSDHIGGGRNWNCGGVQRSGHQVTGGCRAPAQAVTRRPPSAREPVKRCVDKLVMRDDAKLANRVVARK